MGFKHAQVFLNYPFDQEFTPFSYAMHFGVIGAGLIPLCAHDLTVPDRPRLDLLVEAIQNCRFSAHDFSRGKGEGTENFARLNMPIEMGMALFFALQTQHRDHRCAFFVSDEHSYKRYASDLSGLDAKSYNDDELLLLSTTYKWLIDTSGPLANRVPPKEIEAGYLEFREAVKTVNGSGANGDLSHHEIQELMYQICSKRGWWDWRANKSGLLEFPEYPLSWK